MKLWAVVPAAGVGSRFGTALPKQYQLLAGEPVMARTLRKMLALEPAALVVALHPSDNRWRDLPVMSDSRVRQVDGGLTRVDSVRSAVATIAAEARPDDWLLVHDVARPCVRLADIRRLIDTLSNSLVGGILATPISDTVKNVDAVSRQILSTADRSQLWAAQTPQLFRFGLLAEALAAAADSTTDEASAVEQLGYKPVVVEGSRDNLKVTLSEDLAMAEAIIQYQEQHQCA